MFQRGVSPVRLSQLDVRPAVEAAQMVAAAKANLNSSIGQSVLKFQEKQQEKKQKEMTINALKEFAPGLDDAMYKAAANDPEVKESLLLFGREQAKAANQLKLSQQPPQISSKNVNIGTKEAPAIRTIVSILNPMDNSVKTEILTPENTKSIFRDYSDEELKETGKFGYRPKSLERVELDDGTFVNRVYGDVEDRFTYDKSLLPEDVPETKVQEAQRVVKEYNAAYPNNKIDEYEGVQKLISLYQKDQDIVFDFGPLGRFDEEGESLGANVITINSLEEAAKYPSTQLLTDGQGNYMYGTGN